MTVTTRINPEHENEQNTTQGGEGESSITPVQPSNGFTRADNLRCALLVQCPHCRGFFVSVHYTATVMRNLRFGSSQAPLKTRCKVFENMPLSKFENCSANIEGTRTKNTSGKPPFFRLRSYERDNVMAMVNLDARSQVQTLQIIASRLNCDDENYGWRDHRGRQIPSKHLGNFSIAKCKAAKMWSWEVGINLKRENCRCRSSVGKT